jgi:cell division protein FtsI/penicillin-binding protein 2
MSAMLIVAAAACTSQSSKHHDTADQSKKVRHATTKLAHALARKDLSAIDFAGSTAANQHFKELIKPLHSARLTARESGTPRVTGHRARSKLAISWHFSDTKKPWKYTVTASWKRSGKNTAWRPVWKPSLVQPDLTDGAKLAVDRSQRPRGQIIGAHGHALVSKRRVVRVGIDKTRVSGKKAAHSAKRLAKLVDIDAGNYVQRVAAAGKQAFVQAIVFRATDHDLPSQSTLGKIQGAVGLDGHAMLAKNKTFAAGILGRVGDATKEQVKQSHGKVQPDDRVGQFGLEARYDARLRGTPHISVSVIPPEHAASGSSSPTPSSSASPLRHTRQVYESKGSRGKNLTISLQEKQQTRAEKILKKLKPASSLVAIRPSTGAILAAATNAAGEGRNLATSGRYPPGSTFKIVDSLALIRAGMKPSDKVTCPSHRTVDGRKFTNDSGYPPSKLGSITLQTAFAHSCNTAFIGLRHKVDAGDLNKAAASLGAGTDYDVGFPAYFGSIPKPKTRTERGAEMIGQGRVQMSPMALATITASVQHNKTVLPWLVKGKTAKPKGKPLTKSEAKQLQKLMGAVVKRGTGAALSSLQPPKLISKTGTAEYGNAKPPKTHAWMVAAQKDLAVAVFVDKGGTGARVAGPPLKKFLRGS